jgi:hypothetical protein
MRQGYFEPREVKWWPQRRRVSPERLTTRQRIVISGNFLIDSESQLKTALGGASK